MHRMLRFMDFALRKVLAALCIGLVGLMLVTVCWQVVMRYVFNSPLSWSEELARFAMVWMAFCAAALAFRKGTHIKLEGVSLVPRRFSRAGAKTAKALVLAILLAIMYFGWQITLRTATQTSPALSVPMAFIYFSIPFSAGCMLFFALVGWAINIEEASSAPQASTTSE